MSLLLAAAFGKFSPRASGFDAASHGWVARPLAGRVAKRQEAFAVSTMLKPAARHE
jgi:hypothetical protein